MVERAGVVVQHPLHAAGGVVARTLGGGERACGQDVAEVDRRVEHRDIANRSGVTRLHLPVVLEALFGPGEGAEGVVGDLRGGAYVVEDADITDRAWEDLLAIEAAVD